MTRSVPFHKQNDMSKQPGQQTFDRMPFLKHSTAEPQQEQYLSQYIERKTDEPKRITFTEWYTANPPGRFWTNGEFEDYLNVVWNAALKQGKL